MQILADRVIANAVAAFSSFGDVSLFDGRELTPDMLEAADVLLIRSVTKVDAAFLASSPVKFVGTATAGVDHVDVKSLERANIAFASAPACNANAVAEFVATSIVIFCATKKMRAKDVQVAIVGHGAVGTRVEQKLLSLGFRCVLHDPFKSQRDGHREYASLDTALAADILTLHTPLTNDGPYPTYRLLDRPQIQRMKNCRLLINAARGGIVNENALTERMQSDPEFNVQLDCWENEPRINRELIAQTFRASPHVAGHSIEARQNATTMLVQALREWCQSEAGLSEPPRQSVTAGPVVENSGSVRDIFPNGDFRSKVESSDDALALGYLLGQCCPVDEINEAMLNLASLSDEQAGAEFDRLRRQFASRREFSAYQLPIELSSRFAHNSLQKLGFRVG